MVIDFSNLGGGGSGSGYTLPIASQSTLGGIKVGSGLTINPQSGVLSAEGGQGGGIEVVSQLPASGTDGQFVLLNDVVPEQHIKVTGTDLYDTDTSVTAIGITQKTLMFNYELVGLRVYMYVNSDHSLEVYNDDTEQSTVFSSGTVNASYHMEYNGDLRDLTITVTDSGFTSVCSSMIAKENVHATVDVTGSEKQDLYVYGIEPRPAIEYHLSTDGRILSVNWSDVKRVMADGDTMFEIKNFGDISYSAGTLYSKISSGFGTKTPSSTVQSYSFVNFQLDGDMLNFWMKYNRYVSAATFSDKAQASGWTRADIVQENYTEGYATDQRCGMVMVNNRSDGLYMEDGFIKCSVSAATATTASTGVVKVSSGLSITSQGALSTQVQASNVGNNVVHIWLGTQQEYDQIATPDQYTVYIIKNETQNQGA